jgi:hypothetical protein
MRGRGDGVDRRFAVQPGEGVKKKFPGARDVKMRVGAIGSDIGRSLAQRQLGPVFRCY